VSAPSVAPRLPPWWLDEAGRQTAAPQLEGDAAADVCIVGGGYTGLWTALALKERDPSLRIVLVEAETCGAGPSGRNGGFLHGYWVGLADLLSLLGREEALQLARAGERIVPAVRAFCESRGEDVWLRESGTMMVSAAPAQDDALDRAVAAAAEVGADEQAVRLDATGVAERIRSPVFRDGVYFPDGATVQPARLVHALRRAAVDAGVELYEHTPALRIRAGSIATPRGTVRAPEIVVAVNAAATGCMFLHYFRTTADGRVLMGSGSGPIGFRGRVDGRFTSDDATAARAEHGLRRLLPGLADARIERAWGGPIDVSADHLPFFGTVKSKRIHYGLGYSGHGVGPTWLGGQILASLVLQRDDEWTALPLASRRVASLPPEPFKHLGGALVRSAILACERADEQGRRRPLPARLGAALPRLFGMEIGTR
jgi:glycine/D-amino acid oxidase-like deaminating enzyme